MGYYYHKMVLLNDLFCGLHFPKNLKISLPQRRGFRKGLNHWMVPDASLHVLSFEEKSEKEKF